MSAPIGYLVPEFPTQTHIFFWREIQALRAMGEDVRLLSTRMPQPMTCRHEFAPAAIAETHYLFPPRVAALAGWLGGGFSGFPEIFAYLNTLDAAPARARMYGLLASAIDLVDWARRERIRHVHCHSCADAAHVVALASRLGGPSYSLTLHGDLEVYGTDHRAKMTHAAFVCAVGSHLRDQVVSRVGLPANRILVTCMGVEVSDLTELGRDRSFTPGSLHFVTVARLNQVKGHVHALAALHRGLQAGLDLHYTIAGEGPYRDALLARIAELGLGDRVTMPGTLSAADVYRLLSQADAFVLPSTGVGEAWPVSVMEAMGAGLPVISSQIGATGEMITSGVDGFLVAQRDEDALLDKIALLAGDIALRRRIGEAARRTTRKRFDVAATAGALRDAIHASFEHERSPQPASAVVAPRTT
jgi:glycosyltransferase involved in cell wall biosynthesis